MIRAIIVDDELPAIRAIQYLLKDDPDIDVVGTYTDPLLLLEGVDDLRPDVVFLDIEMRDTNGLIVAEQLYELLPDVHLVFVTAYNEYAISAFELGALDYLLKPVSENRIDKTLQRIKRERRGQPAIAKQEETMYPSKPHLHVRCFGHLQVSIEASGNTEPIMWRTAKAEELFALFMHYYGRPLHKDFLIEQLWTDLFYDNALMQLHTAVYQIRKLLKYLHNGSELRYRQDCYHLLLTEYTCDVDRFKLLVKEAGMNPGEKLMDIVIQAKELYIDPYLEGNGYLWSMEESRRLADQFNELQWRAVRHYIDTEQEKESIPYLRQLIQRNPLHEGYYRQLLSVYARLHDYKSVKELYAKLVISLEQELGESPHPDTVAHYESLIG
ncbi:response regulator [Paenibacillaceae bacterium WGS1546]|uniref:response regulator n=1 Tax=Cohnella sp. WGS1546 TaxID=3366810 RepID=UPI00372D759D